jgi:hypothetical protein
MSIFTTLLENDETAKLEAWKAGVKKAHPDYASKIQFKGRTEPGKDGKSRNLINAEVPGLDRSFGVFNLDDPDDNEVLGD